MTPFCAIYGGDPPQLLTYKASVDDPPIVSQLLQHKDKILSLLKSNLLKAQVRMKRFADAHRSEISFVTGNWVFVKLKPYCQHFVSFQWNQKLGMKYFGPF